MMTEPKVIQFITPEKFGLERFPPGTTVLDLVTCRVDERKAANDAIEEMIGVSERKIEDRQAREKANEPKFQRGPT